MEQRKMKFRVLKDFTDREGKERRADEIIEMAFADAQAFVNSDKLTADLGNPPMEGDHGEEQTSRQR